jgi:predicted negative regulator of RcsB-dependent stress response
MKKNILYMALAGVLGLTSCKKQLELINPQSIDASLALGTDTKVKQVLIGNYAALGASSLFGGDIIWMSELMASNGKLRWVGTFPDPRSIWGKQIQIINSYVRSTYSQAYRVIYNSNNILANLNVVNEADKNKVEGEAKFLRALVYFELIKFFGEKPYSFGNTGLKGVPLVTTPRPGDPLSDENKLPRNSIGEVYTQIVADLNDAVNLLPNTNGVYATKSAAALALARVYLQQLNYEGALAAATTCINSASGKSLVLTSYADAFNNSANTVEDLFSMQVNTQSGTNSNFTFFSTATYGARDGDIEVSDAFVSSYDADDERADLYFFENASYHVGKWREAYKNVKVMRLAEAYLIRAECYVRANNTAAAAEDLAKTLERAGLTKIAAPTLADVLAERQKELAFEGQAFADVKRLKLTTDGLAYDDPKMVFPIPQRETNIYQIEQNPGY